jgi:hypothetical protein
MIDQDFSDIAPYDDNNFYEHLKSLVKEPGFEHAVKWVMPDVDYADFAAKLLAVKSQRDFQHDVMASFLEMLEANTTDGISCEGFENYDPSKCYTLITNHRDIVLDASFLNLCLMRHGKPTCEIAIGNNLLIFPWINDLVRVNKSFIVKRDTGTRGALEAAQHLSAYIHYAITRKHQSVWIAHREGRAKDSDDRTQDSLIKMLGLAGEGSAVERVAQVNLMPVTISYEFDPNDYLKVREFLLKRRDPEYRKSQQDDLLSMETGLLQHKGRVHFAMSQCITPQILEQLEADADRSTVAHTVASLVDASIHANYRLFPINYIAYDSLTGEHRFADRYTAEELASVTEYVAGQLAKVDVPDLTDDELAYMREMMLTMYANPLRNKLKL